MSEARESSEKTLALGTRVFMAAILVGIFMVPAALAVDFWGLNRGLAVLAAEVALAGWIVRQRLQENRLSLAEFLTTRATVGSHVPPPALVVLGCLFWGPGLYTLVTLLHEAQAGGGQENVVQRAWFAATLLIAGAGISGLGGVRWLIRRDVRRKIERLTDTIATHPRQPEYYLERGTLWFDHGKVDKAIEDFSQAIELDPQCVAAYMKRGRAHYFLNQHDEAIRDFSKAIELAPDDPVAYLDRGLAYYHSGRPEQCEADVARARERAPEQPE